MEACTICREADSLGRRRAGDPSLCPPCGMLFQWFLAHYGDVGFREQGWITLETSFHELSIEPLDCLQWLLEAQE
jgi:hypothetical protein